MQSLHAVHPKVFVAVCHLAGVGAAALLLASCYALAFRPLQAQEEEHERRSDHLAAMLEDSIEVRREHAQLRKRLEELSSRVANTHRLTPQKSRESEFLADAARIASESGLEIADYRRGRTRYLPTHAELDITLNGFGGHAGICRFLAEMHSLPRAKQVHRLGVESSDNTHSYPLEVAYTLYFGLTNGSEAPTPSPAL